MPKKRKCLYCNKRIVDMIKHLTNNPYCRKRHAEKLGKQLNQIIKLHQEGISSLRRIAGNEF